jgi:Protein of unknown function (DUF2797)
MSQLIRFYSGEGKPSMIFRSGDDIATAELGGREDIDFSEKRACIGFRTPEGYRMCRNGAINIRQCPSCANLDMARAYTVGDFSGYPALYLEAKQEEYCLYLAGFGEDIVKCGVTRKERFLERMREQGADFGCIVAAYAGPDRVYDAEQAVQSRFSFANSVRIAQKIRRLEFDVQEARQNFLSAVELVRSSGVLPDFAPEVNEFSSQYPKMKNPMLTYSVLGEIQGAKGEILIFKSESGRQFAVDMRGKVGSFFERK